MRSRSPTISMSVWRLPICQARRANSSGLAAIISISGSGLPATRTIVPSSRTRPSPSRNAVACGRSSRKAVPCSPVSATLRRWRSSASRTTRSMAVAAFQLPALLTLRARCIGGPSEQEVALRHRQHLGRRAGEQLAVGGYLIGLRIDLDLGRRAVVHHALLRNAAAGIFDCHELFLDSEPPAQAAPERGLRHEHDRR